MTGYLTPDTLPANTVCRVLFIPDNEEFIANVQGALQLLTFPSSWTKYGAVDPVDAAAAMVPMFDALCFNQGRCKMIGEIILWAGVLNPDDSVMLLCDGTHVTNVDYPDLYNIIGLTYGGTGPTDFALPDMRGNVAIGEGGIHTLGSIGGQESVTLGIPEMPGHSHTDLGHSHIESTALPNVTTIGAGAPQPTAVPGVGATGQGFASISDTGGDVAHENMQPYLTLSYYIVVLGK